MSHTLHPVEKCYHVIEKLVLTLTFSTQRLHQYFKSLISLCELINSSNRF